VAAAMAMLTVREDRLTRVSEYRVKDFLVGLVVDLINKDKTVTGAVPAAVPEDEAPTHQIITQVRQWKLWVVREQQQI
jgi:hypothetical protein